jgi:diguanylate cyclase (GGDEF)-like protein/PAS domain S-box-containing protein
VELDPDWYRPLVELSPDAAVVIQDGFHAFANVKALSLYGAESLAELRSRPAIEFMAEDYRPQAEVQLAIIADTGAMPPTRERLLRLDGTIRDIESSACQIMFEGRSAVLSVIRDITERVAADAELEAVRARFHAAFAHAPVGMGLVDDSGCFIELNHEMATMLGLAAGTAEGRNLLSFVDEASLVSARQCLDSARRGAPANRGCQLRMLRPDERSFWASVSLSPIPSSGLDRAKMVVQMQDVTDQVEAHDRLEHQARHDALTGLPNRLAFLEMVEVASQDTAPDAMFAVLFCDLDRFKLVNDSLGHDVGDRLLITVSRRLTGRIQPNETVARFGGDEFTVLCRNIASVADAEACAARLGDALRDPFRLDSSEFHTNLSIGIAVGRQGQDANAIVREADTAMYEAKRGGGRGSRVFEPLAHRRVVDQLNLESAFRRALTSGEIGCQYQPVVQLSTGRISSVEALARWQCADGTVVAPDVFVLLAEELGLAGRLTELVLDTALGQFRRWEDRALVTPSMTLSINVSPIELGDASCSDRIADALEHHRLDPGRLGLEITEHRLAADLDTAVKTIERLRVLGVQMLIDDFGSGYSSLGKLSELPVHWVKIDRTFLHAVSEGSPRSRTVLEGVIRLVRGLTLGVIVEGVEEPWQVQLLQEFRCAYGQGYYLARPAWPADLEPMLAAGHIIAAVS